MPPLSAARPGPANGLATLLVLGTLLLPLAGFTAKVSVAVDGVLLDGRVTSETVGDVLADLQVPIGPFDRVVPAVDTPVSEGLAIRIERAVSFTVVSNRGTFLRTVAPVASVQGALELAGHGDARTDGAVVSPSLREPVTEGLVIRVRYPVTVTVAVDGEVREFATTLSDVGSLLVAEGIEVRDTDRVTPPLDTPIDDAALAVTIERVDSGEVAVEVTLPRGLVNRRSAEMDLGTSKVLQEGRTGVRVDTYLVVRVDGEEESRELVSQVVTVEPEDRIIVYGTRVTTGSTIWDQLAQCESRGNWALDGPLYDGGLQFHPNTWNSFKLAGYPEYAWMASREQQIEVGIRVQARQGWNAWPACASKLGLI
jgi:uncharacterized protein YabE (DUF348 family)